MTARKSPFWFRNSHPLSEPLEKRCAEAATLVNARGHVSTKKCESLSELLLLIAASRLPDAQTNEFWPHFHREIQNLSGVECSRAEVADFFRAVLRRAYPERLDDIRSSGVHAYFIALIFEQAGIGANRKRVIRSFLGGLLNLIRGGGELEAIRPEGAVADFREANPDERDIDPLVPVLIEISAAVVGFAKFLRDSSNRLELAELNWEELASVWRRASGIDPEALTPSARELLHEVVRGLARVVTRNDAFQFVREGRFQIRVPGDGESSEVRPSPMEYPIGPARIVDALGSRNVVLLDDVRFPPEVLVALSAKGWRETDDGLTFKVEPEPFVAKAPDGRRSAAIPLWTGQSPETAVLVGYYWGMYFPPQSGATPRTTDRLWIKSVLRIYGSQLCLYVNWFSGSTSLNSDEATLRIGSREVWKGRVAEGRPLDFAPLKLNIAPGDVVDARVTFCLETPDSKPVRRSIGAAFLREPAFLVCNGRLVEPLTEFPILVGSDGTVEELVLYRTDSTLVHVSGALAKEELPCELAGWRFVAMRLQLAPVGDGTARIVAGLTEWNLAVQRRIHFRADCTERKQFGNVSVVGSVAILPIAMEEVPYLILEEASAPVDGRAPANLTLHVNAGRRFTLHVEHSQCRRVGSIWRIEIGSVIRAYLPTFAAGPLEVGLGLGAREPDQWISFFAFSAAPEILPCRVGEPSTLVPVRDSSWPRLSSGWIVDRGAIDSRRLASASLRCADAAMTFQWLPAVEDFLVGEEAQWSAESRAILLSGFGRGPIPAHAIGAVGSEWIIHIGTHELRIASGSSQDIREPVLNALTERNTQDIEIRAGLTDAERPNITWYLDALPRILDPEFMWPKAPADEIATLTFEFNAVSLVPARATIEFLASGRVAASHEVVLGQGRGGAEQMTVSADLILHPIDGDDVTVVVVRCASEGRQFFVSEVPTPQIQRRVPIDATESANTSKMLLETFCEQPTDAIGETLLLRLLQHTSVYGDLPIPVKSIRTTLQLRGGPSPTTTILSHCVALIQSLTVQSVVPIVSVDAECSPILKVLEQSLKIFHCHVMASAGVLAPARLTGALGGLSRVAPALASPRWRDWSEGVLEFGQSGILATPVIQSETRNQKLCDALLSEPLSMVYPPFAKWLTIH